MKGRTCVVIAHHLGTIQHADVIFVLKDAQLVARGTHDELLTEGGLYSDMYHLQNAERTGATAGQRARA
jgi:ABC-type multidrug transport system fused ATPase/permease subunit